MSNETKSPVAAVPADVQTDTSTETKRPNILVRGYRWMRTNPKTTIAVVAGSALVGGAALLGRKTAPYHVEIVETDESEVFEPLETTVLDDSVAS